LRKPVCSVCGTGFDLEYPFQAEVGDGEPRYYCTTGCRTAAKAGVYRVNKAGGRAADGPRRIAVFNHKGGTGKTTTAVNLAAGLAERGLKVLLVDADGQGNVGASLGIRGEKTLYHVLVSGLRADEAAVPVRQNLDVLTSNELLAAAELYLAEPSQREEAYAYLLDAYLPAGLYGVALAALLASVMSTISSHLSYGSQTLVNDVARQAFPTARLLRPGSSGAVWVGRFLMLAILALGVAVTFNATSLIGIAVVLAGMYGATATVYWGQWWWWRVNFWSWLAAMVGGPLVYVALGGLGIGSITVPGVLGQFPAWAAARAVSESSAQRMDMLQAALGMGLTFLLWVTVTLLTKPEPMETLKAFYRRARPMGAWGPVRRACLAEADGWSPPPSWLLLPGLGVAVVGAIAVSSGVLAASVLFVGRWGQGAALLAVCGGAGLAFAKLFDRHLTRLGADA